MPPTDVPFTDALVQAVKGITDQLLLYVLAGTMIVVGAAVAGPPDADELVVPLLVLLCVGLVARTLVETSRVRRGRQRVDQDQRLGLGARRKGHSRWGSTHVDGSESVVVQQRVRGGWFSSHEGDVTHGDLRVGQRTPNPAPVPDASREAAPER